MLKRRDLLLSGPTAVLLARTGLAQQSVVARIGVIAPLDSRYPGYVEFREELAGLGYVEGRNLVLESRFSAGKVDVLAGFAAELMKLNVDMFAVFGAVTVRAVREATNAVPVVFTVVLDPVADGLVADATRPGGNITGATNFDPAQPRAQMRLLKQIVPGLAGVAIIGDAGVPDLLDLANKEAAEAEGLRPLNIRLRGPDEDIDAVFARIREERVGAILGLEVPNVGSHGNRITSLAVANRLPTMFPGDAERFNPMIAYGSSLFAAARRMAVLVDRILKGSKPGDLAIEVVKNHRLVVNQRVAQQTGVTIPPHVLSRADKVVV